MWHYLEGLLFSLTPEEYCTRAGSSAHVVLMLKKSTALEWLALCFLPCVLGVLAALAYKF